VAADGHVVTSTVNLMHPPTGICLSLINYREESSTLIAHISWYLRGGGWSNALSRLLSVSEYTSHNHIERCI